MRPILWKIAANGPWISAHLGGLLSLIVGMRVFGTATDVAGWIFFPAAYACGMALGNIFIWPWLRLLAFKYNGYPFKVGDRVKILSGKHCNKEGKVYDIWESRHQVRVDIGSERKELVDDVFSYHKIRKISQHL